MARIAPYIFWQEMDDNGDPLAGGKVYFYEAGTSTPKDTYTDASENTANANPVILDSAGRANIWLASGAYKIVIKDSDDVTIATRDDVTGDTANAFGSQVFSIATNLTLTETYQNSFIECTATLTISMLAAADAAEGFVFSVRNNGSGLVTLDPDGSETINGESTLVLAADQWAILVCDGTNWKALENKDPLNNLNASAAPTVNDDSGDGYSVGSMWYDTTADEAYVCLDATLTAAVWVETTLTTADLGTSATKDFIDDDTFATASATTTASSESIKAYIDAAVAAITLAPDYESSAITVATGNQQYTATHGLGAIPYFVQAVLKCTTTDMGYAVDDEVVLTTQDDGTRAISLWANATTIGVSQLTNLKFSVKAGTSSTSPTYANWKLYLRAWR